ncbi:kinase-like domain-containing protein [Lentinula edodes]|uniref:Kinase-like domain-containing protein n=1 Tax=Lentinula lateritia TaxID=40482 RepID=A0A9W9AAV8_9AGAR|nr:kinase-like domain-containing protein [Lentinula edodes]
MLLSEPAPSSSLTKTQIFSLVTADDFHEKRLAVSDVDEAAWVMEILQSELDRAHSTKSTQYRRRCLKLMRHLNRSHGVLPPSMYLKDLVCESTTAVTGGGFADIWIGRWENRRVCVKVLRFFQLGSDRDKLLKDLSKEVLLWKQLKHPNILPFLGVNADLFSPSFCIISPWMSNGDVMSYSRRLSLDIRTRLEHTIQIAEGIAYLHGLDPPVVHGDIKGANILISDDCRCCLADFGLSVLDTQSINATHTATVQGSLRWLAPEFINPTPTPQHNQGKLTSRDIYAFGCTVFELLTGQPPFYHHNLDIKVAIDVLNGVRPVLSTDVVPNETIYKAICRMLDTCWSEQIMGRPDAEGVLESLRRMQDDLQVQVPKIDVVSGTFSTIWATFIIHMS